MSRPTRRAGRLLAGLGAVALATGLGLAAAAPAYAATFTVTDGSASGPNTLTQAIIDLNTSGVAGTIQIAPGLAIDMGAVSTQVKEPVTVIGDASNPPTITGPSIAAPIFQVVNQTDFEMDNVTMVGRATSGSPITFVSSSATVKLVGDSISNFPHPAVEFLLQTGPVTITDCTFSGNSSTVADADGGAIVGGSFGDVTITGSTFSNNSAGKHGGAIEFNAAHSVDISGSTFTGNSAGTFGGAIAVTSLAADSTWTGNTFIGNTSSAATNSIGGAAFYVGTVATGATLVIDQSTFTGNTAAATASSTSGAVGFVNAIDGTVQVLDSTMTGNSFLGVGPGATGFGIDVAVAAIDAGGEFDIGQSTFDEVASGSDLIYVNTNLGHTRLALDTLVGPGALIVSNNNSVAADAVQVLDTIAVSNSPADAADISGAPAQIGYSITSSAAGPTLIDLGGTQFGVADPQLGALANNGGPTRTRLPLAGSPAIDKGDPSLGGSPATDQRGSGFPRIVNGRVDIGAVELQSATAPTLSKTGVDPVLTVWTASTSLAAGLLLLGAVLLTRRARRSTAE